MQRNYASFDLNVPVPFVWTIKPLNKFAPKLSKNGVGYSIEQHPISVIGNRKFEPIIFPGIENLHMNSFAMLTQLATLSNQQILVMSGIYLRFICARWLATRESFFHLFFSAIADLTSCLRARYVNSFCNFS